MLSQTQGKLVSALPGAIRDLSTCAAYMPAEVYGLRVHGGITPLQYHVNSHAVCCAAMQHAAATDETTATLLRNGRAENSALSACWRTSDI